MGRKIGGYEVIRELGGWVSRGRNGRRLVWVRRVGG